MWMSVDPVVWQGHLTRMWVYNFNFIYSIIQIFCMYKLQVVTRRASLPPEAVSLLTSFAVLSARSPSYLSVAYRKLRVIMSRVIMPEWKVLGLRGYILIL